MADRPILFSGPMVRALIAGTKTQTRRLLKNSALAAREPQWEAKKGPDGVWRIVADTPEVSGRIVPDIRIAAGDRLWVRESLKIESTDQGVRYPTYAADGAKLWPLSEWTRDRSAVPSIHMPRYASRLTLTVTDVRVERLQDISEADAKAEGITEHPALGPHRGPDATFWAAGDGKTDHNARLTPISAYKALWEEINGEGSWDVNPWVAAYTFTVEQGNIDLLASKANG